MKTSAANQQARAIDFAVNTKPTVLKAFTAMSRAITLSEGLDALTNAAVFRFDPNQDWRLSIPVAELRNDAAIRTFLERAPGRSHSEGSRPMGPTKTTVSLSLTDNTNAPWERYTANYVSLKLETTGRNGEKQTTYYGLDKPMLEVVVKMANPKFGAQELYRAASKLPLE